jgi:hypothetical protein
MEDDVSDRIDLRPVDEPDTKKIEGELAERGS